jgi:hypothetical protein
MAKKRARNDKGQFVGDDPDTPENEAWVTVGGVEASGTTDPEPEKEKPELMGPTGYVILFFAFLILALFGVSG